VDTPTGTRCLAAVRASMRSAPGPARLHMPIGLTPNGNPALSPTETVMPMSTVRTTQNPKP
jgi:hypothetical protein